LHNVYLTLNSMVYSLCFC